jgi:hypothetical protein
MVSAEPSWNTICAWLSRVVATRSLWITLVPSVSSR